MKIDGRCHCGKIAYEAEVDPESVGICHCTDCQTFSGSAFRVGVAAQPGTFRLLYGQPKEYVKTAESGAHRVQGFCADCGTALYSTSPGPEIRIYRLRVPTVRQRDALPPKMQGWTRSKFMKFLKILIIIIISIWLFFFIIGMIRTFYIVIR